MLKIVMLLSIFVETVIFYLFYFIFSGFFQKKVKKQYFFKIMFL